MLIADDVTPLPTYGSPMVSSGLGSIAPLGGPQAGEELLGQGDEGLGADLRLTRALRLLVLGLYGLPNCGDPTLEQLLGDRNLFGRQGGDQRVAVGASGVQTLRTGSGRALIGRGCGTALSAAPRPAVASVRPRRTLALTPLRAIPAGRATTLAPTAPFVPAGDRRADEWALGFGDELETFGLSAAESIACGTPAILTEGVGIAPQVEDRAGLVVPHEAGAIRDALQRLIRDQRLLEQLRKGTGEVARELSWEGPAARLESLLRQVVEENARNGVGPRLR